MGAWQFKTRHRDTPGHIVWGSLEIASLAEVDARVSCFAHSDDVAGVSIWDPVKDFPLVYVQMYRLPAANARLTEDLQLCASEAKAWPLPDGKPFEPTMLAPRGMPGHWRHKAIQTFAGGPGVVHAYRGQSRALLIRYATDRGGDPLNEPLFRWAAANVRLVDGAWRIDPPHPARSDEDDELAGPDDMGAYAMNEENEDGGEGFVDLSAETSDRPLNATELAQVRKNADRARQAFQIPAGASIDAVISAIRNAVDEARVEFHTFKPNVKHNLSISLGSLWGEMLCKVTGWQWCGFTRDGGEEFLAIVSPDGAYVVSPNDFLIDQLMRSGPEADNTVRLLFNMIREAKLPPSKPGAYRMLG